MPSTIRFSKLSIGQHFRFVDGHGLPHGHFKKVAPSCYVRAIKSVTRDRRRASGLRVYATLQRVCYRGLSGVKVISTARTSPIKRRAGRGRGPSTLGGYKRRRRSRR